MKKWQRKCTYYSCLYCLDFFFPALSLFLQEIKLSQSKIRGSFENVSIGEYLFHSTKVV